jgi:hypothetical protein
MHNVVESLRQMTTGTGARFVLQPLLAIAAGVLMGRLDSHSGRGVFGRRVFARSKEDEHPLLQSFRRVEVPLCLALALSLVFQYLDLKTVHLVPSLFVAVCLVPVPHLCARDLSSRFDGWWNRSPRGARTRKSRR